MQHTSFGEANLTTYIKVDKADGRVLYYKVAGEQNIEVSKEEYMEANK